MKTLKKIMSLILCICITLSFSPMPTLANTLDCSISGIKQTELPNIELLLGRKTLDLVATDVQLLNQYGICSKNLININVDASDTLVYTYVFSDQFTSSISIHRCDTGILFKTYEDNLYNEVLFENSGKVYLDGNEITVANNESQILPLSPRIIEEYYVDTCPYGRPSDYNDYIETNSSANIALQETIANITISAFSLIISLFLPPAVAFSVGLVTTILTTFRGTSPYSNAVSYKDYVYGYKDGYWVTDTLSVRKHSIYIYSETNYNGTVENHYSYFCHEIGY